MSPRILTDLDVLSMTVYGESRSEPVDSQIGVAWAIRNRVDADIGHDGKPDWWGEGYIGVCLQHEQFSCWNDGDPNRAILDGLSDQLKSGAVLQWPSFVQCRWAAEGVIASRVCDPTRGATHYYAEHIAAPAWTNGALFTVRLGHHLFYTAVK